MARAAGFARVVDASDAYDGLDAARLAVEPDDFHPNADGHARLAHGLDEALAALPEVRRLRTRGSTSGEAARSGHNPAGWVKPPEGAGPGTVGFAHPTGRPAPNSPQPPGDLDLRDPNPRGVPHR